MQQHSCSECGRHFVQSAGLYKHTKEGRCIAQKAAKLSEDRLRSMYSMLLDMNDKMDEMAAENKLIRKELATLRAADLQQRKIQNDVELWYDKWQSLIQAHDQERMALIAQLTRMVIDHSKHLHSVGK